MLRGITERMPNQPCPFAIVLFPPLAAFLLIRRYLGDNSDQLAIPLVSALVLFVAIGTAHKVQVSKLRFLNSDGVRDASR